MSTTAQMWLLAMLIPAFMFLGQNMCVWPAPRFLGGTALLLLYVSMATFSLFLAALPAALYFVVTAFVNRGVDGEFLHGISNALACVWFMGLWILSGDSAFRLRHRAFVKTSLVGDQIARALAQYRSDRGEYPEILDQLVPGYLERVPYTGLIAYPEFSYLKDRNDLQSRPDTYELRIDCTSGPLNFDRFIYWPSEICPDLIQDKHAERIRAWVYIHE